MYSLFLAIQFLTILNLRIKEAEPLKMARSMVYFPVVGLLIGLFLCGINAGLSIFNFSPIATNTILLIALIIITGGMHLDGLSDAIDALFSGKTKEEMLEIMRDPRVGVMGVLSLIVIILLKIGLLSSLNPALKTTALLLMCTLSRWSAVLEIFLFPYARKEGKARIFIQGITPEIFILSTGIVVVLAFMIWQLKGLLLVVTIATATAFFGKFICDRIGGITGDTLGATIEITEAIILFGVSIS